MAIAVRGTELSVQNMTRRMTFHFGNVHVEAGPQILLELRAEIDGKQARGVSMGALAPMWFYKNPDMSMEQGVGEMLAVFEQASARAEALDSTQSVFGFWRDLYDAMDEWAAEKDYPPLLWGYGVSLVEQALIDAFCSARETTFPEAVHENTLGIDLGSCYEELAGCEPTDLLPDEPLRSTAIRHTVGLSDPLTSGEIPEEDRLEDGLPQTLSEYITEQGIDHFKIKLGATDADADRLARIHEVIQASQLESYRFSLDANEQYGTAEAFRSRWDALKADDRLTEFFENLLYVEQPLARDEAFTEETRATFAEWDGPPIIIDESDDHPQSLKRALSCGYAGTSHKNCKGVFKGIANRCLIEHHRQHESRELLMSGEDLTTLGPIELQEDLTVMAVLGMDNVERNGHHYYRGLSMLSQETQDAVLERHDDLYRRHEDGFPTLAIQDGRIELDSILEAPFGHAVEPDHAQLVPVDEWTVESISR